MPIYTRQIRNDSEFAGVCLVGEKGLEISYRSRWDIIAEILSVALSGEIKTHIMYKCNLSFKQVQTYLDLLIDLGLLKAESRASSGRRAQIFATTDKGRNFSKAYSNLKATSVKERV